MMNLYLQRCALVYLMDSVCAPPAAPPVLQDDFNKAAEDAKTLPDGVTDDDKARLATCCR